MKSKQVFKTKQEEIIKELTIKILDKFKPLSLDNIITSDLHSILNNFSYHYLIFNHELENFVNDQYCFAFEKNYFFINKIFSISYQNLKLSNSKSIISLHMKVHNAIPNNTFGLSVSTSSPIMSSIFNAEHLNFNQENLPFVCLDLPLNYKLDNELPVYHLIQSYIQEHMQIIYNHYNIKITQNIEKLSLLTDIFTLLKTNNIVLNKTFLPNHKYSLLNIFSILKSHDFLNLYDSIYLKTDKNVVTIINNLIK